jgi:HPt (histidine-containing phosphotransfer) domain-containing protein
VDEGELKRYFAGRLPARVAEVEAARDAARGAGWTGEPLHTFHRLAHSLAGVGSTFGYPEVTAVATRLESLLKTALAMGVPPAADGIDTIDALLAHLREIAGRCGPAAAPPTPTAS